MAEYEKKVREILKNIWSDKEKVTMRYGLVL